MATFVKIRIRRDSTSNWQAANPLLLLGEIGCDMDKKLLKVGDGTKYWNDLPYIGGGGSGGTIPIVKPDNPKAGDVYFDLTVKKLKVYDGTTWIIIGDLPDQPGPNPKPGDLYYDTTAKKIKYWNGTAWIALLDANDVIPVYASHPQNPRDGLLYYNSTKKKYYYWNNSKWIPVDKAHQGPTQPTDPEIGDVWYDTNAKRLKYWNGSAWIALADANNAGIPVYSSHPANPTDGLLYYNNGNAKTYYFWNNSEWVDVGGTGSGIIPGPTPPPNPKVGALWYDTNEKKVKYWNGTAWIALADAISSGGINSYTAATFNATSPAGKDGDLLYAFDTKQFYRWSSNKWNKLEIAGTPIDFEALKAEILAAVDELLNQKLRSYQLFGQTYTITSHNQGRPTSIKFDDNITCTIEWKDETTVKKITASTGEIIVFFYSRSAVLIGRVVCNSDNEQQKVSAWIALAKKSGWGDDLDIYDEYNA